jgi:hypothetical protein
MVCCVFSVFSKDRSSQAASIMDLNSVMSRYFEAQI